jgi:hypothetical protein
MTTRMRSFVLTITAIVVLFSLAAAQAPNATTTSATPPAASSTPGATTSHATASAPPTSTPAAAATTATTPATASSQPPPPPPSVPWTATVTVPYKPPAIGVLRDDGIAATLTANEALRATDLLPRLAEKQKVLIEVVPNTTVLTAVDNVELTASRCFWALLLSFIGLFVVSTILLGGGVLKLAVGLDNRLSNSKTQVALWFGILITTYVAALFLRAFAAGWDRFGGVDIPKNLALLSGMSAFTFGAAKAIRTNNEAKKGQAAAAAVGAAAGGAAVGAAVASGGVPPPATVAVVATTPPVNRAAKPSLRDLFTDDNGNVDVGDFQMVIVTLLAVGVYLVQAFNYLHFIPVTLTTTLPDVDSTILATFGLGQGAYLVKKMAGDSA